jgi:hypothetical protein
VDALRSIENDGIFEIKNAQLIHQPSIRAKKIPAPPPLPLAPPVLIMARTLKVPPPPPPKSPPPPPTVPRPI